MPRKRIPEPEGQAWIVPMRITYEADVVVFARDADEAREIARDGDPWEDTELGSAIDWEVAGQPKVNE